MKKPTSKQLKWHLAKALLDAHGIEYRVTNRGEQRAWIWKHEYQRE